MIVAMFNVLNLLSVHICSKSLLDSALVVNMISYCMSMLYSVSLYIRGGRFSDGWGSCERREKKFNKPNNDIPSTAETRAKNKACQVCLPFSSVVIFCLSSKSYPCTFVVIAFSCFGDSISTSLDIQHLLLDSYILCPLMAILKGPVVLH